MPTQFELVTPVQTLFSGQAEMIVCRTVEGEIAFLADHTPYIGALDTCVVRIVNPEGAASGVQPEATGTSGPEIRVAVQGGFVEVKSNQVIMLADVAQLASDVDVSQARSDETAASGRAGSTEGDEAKQGEAELRWAQVRLEAAQAS